MIKIITAIGNPNLNYDLRKYDEFDVLGNDIQYMDGILELLDINNNVNYIIVSEILNGQIKLIDLIDIIYKINKKIKIIVILKEKNSELEDVLIKKGVLDIFYNKENISEIINLLKTKNIENLNKELRAEIEDLKRIIIEKNNKKIFKNKKTSNESNIFNNKCKSIGIIGNNGIGKSSFIYFLSNILKEKNRILILDFNKKNNDINVLFNVKKEYVEKECNSFKLNNYIKKVNKNIDVVTDINYIFTNEKINLINFINEICKIKNNYNYILLDIDLNFQFIENELILNFCDNLLLLTNKSKLEGKKTESILKLIYKKINFNNINLVLYKCNIFDYLILNKKNIEDKLFNIKILGKIRYSILYNKYIQNYNYIKYNFLLKKVYLSLIKKLDN